MAADQRQRLLERLEGIGASLERSGKALALLALGSVGVELERLDEYSDLDFFALIGEALTCLYSGLGRHLRGERLSAQRFIQHFAVDRVLDLMAQLEPNAAAPGDPFSRERRFEKRFPASARFLPGFIQGYDSNPESALAILEFLDVHFEISPFLRDRIRELCESADKTR